MKKDARFCRVDDTAMLPYHKPAYYVEQFELNLHPWLLKHKGSHQCTH